MPGVLRVEYDGRRRGREYVVIEPGTIWGEKAYGLKPEDDYRFDPPAPSKGTVVQLHVSDEALRLLRLQRNIRKDNARAHRPRTGPRWRRP